MPVISHKNWNFAFDSPSSRYILCGNHFLATKRLFGYDFKKIHTDYLLRRVLRLNLAQGLSGWLVGHQSILRDLAQSYHAALALEFINLPDGHYVSFAQQGSSQDAVPSKKMILVAGHGKGASIFEVSFVKASDEEVLHVDVNIQKLLQNGFECYRGMYTIGDTTSVHFEALFIPRS